MHGCGEHLQVLSGCFSRVDGDNVLCSASRAGSAAAGIIVVAHYAAAASPVLCDPILKSAGLRAACAKGSIISLLVAVCPGAHEQCSSYCNLQNALKAFWPVSTGKGLLCAPVVFSRIWEPIKIGVKCW